MTSAIAPRTLGWSGVQGQPGETGASWIRRIEATVRRESKVDKQGWQAMTMPEREKVLRDRGLLL